MTLGLTLFIVCIKTSTSPGGVLVISNQIDQIQFIGGDYEVVGEEGVVIYQSTTGDATAQRALMHFLT